MHGLFDLMELYDKALDKIIKAHIKEDEAAAASQCCFLN